MTALRITRRIVVGLTGLCFGAASTLACIAWMRHLYPLVVVNVVVAAVNAALIATNLQAEARDEG